MSTATLRLIHAHGAAIGQARLARLLGERRMAAYFLADARLIRRMLAYHLETRRGAPDTGIRVSAA